MGMGLWICIWIGSPLKKMDPNFQIISHFFSITFTFILDKLLDVWKFYLLLCLYLMNYSDFRKFYLFLCLYLINYSEVRKFLIISSFQQFSFGLREIFFNSFWLIFCPLVIYRSAYFLRIQIQEAKMLQIQQIWIWILSTI